MSDSTWNIPIPNDLTVLVTGGLGFIGSNFLRLAVPHLPNVNFVNIDKVTYAANPLNLESIHDAANYAFAKVDIADPVQVASAFNQYQPDWVIHFAAESHVDRSILNPQDFVFANVVGTYNLLEACRKLWADKSGKLFHHVSTDEVYGSLGEDGLFTESTAYDPSSPYSASKASSDHFVRAYNRTYGLPTRITNCSNNYGPYHFPEKLIPLMILNAIEGKPLPVYGKGLNVRDWLYVEDHCRAIWTAACKGRDGETYNVGGNSEKRNIDVVNQILATVANLTGKPLPELQSLITYVQDRPGHDLRYAIDATKIRTELGWEPVESFDSGLAKTVSWYLDNEKWVESVRTGAYQSWIDQNYVAR